MYVARVWPDNNKARNRDIITAHISVLCFGDLADFKSQAAGNESLRMRWRLGGEAQCWLVAARP